MVYVTLHIVFLLAAATLASKSPDFGQSEKSFDKVPLSPSLKFSAGGGDAGGIFYTSLAKNFVGDELLISLEEEGNKVIPVVINIADAGRKERISEDSLEYLYEHAATELGKVFLKASDNYNLSHFVNASTEKFCATEPSIEKQQNFRKKRQVDVIPELVSYSVDILSVVDYTLFEKLRSVENLIHYLRIYWNTVDQRFAALQDVQIKIRLKAIMYSSSLSVDTALLDTHDSLEARVDTSKVKFSKAIAGFRGIFDVAHLLTLRSLYVVENGVKRYGAFGAAHSIASACNVTPNVAYNSGIAEDDGNFGGVWNSAHIIAHNLGAHHDDTVPAESCYGGFIMSPVKLINSSNNFLFSDCSASAMKETYFKQNVQCLHSSSPQHFEYPNVLPGLVESLQIQCIIETEHPNAVPHAGIPAGDHCVDLVCQFRALDADFTVHANAPGFEGAKCGINSYCRDGLCTPSTFEQIFSEPFRSY